MKGIKSQLTWWIKFRYKCHIRSIRILTKCTSKIIYCNIRLKNFLLRKSYQRWSFCEIPVALLFLCYSYITIDLTYDFEFEHDYKHRLIENQKLLKQNFYWKYSNKKKQIYLTDPVDFEQQYEKVLIGRIEDKEIQVKYCNEKQYDNSVCLLIENHLVVDVKNWSMMVDIDDLQNVYIEYTNLNVLEQDLFEIRRRIRLAK